MLVRRDAVVIGQPAHAWLSGQLARAWGNDAFPAPEPREEFCLAAEQHDVGWADADLAPTLGPDGRPLSFMQQPRTVHLAIWSGAARRLLAQSRYAALLVSLHGTSLYERVDASSQPEEVRAAIAGYMAGERALQAALAQGLDGEQVDRNRRLLLALDRLSLLLCHGESGRLPDVPAAGEPATIAVESAGGADARYALDPWPFAAESVAVACEGRLLDGEYRDDAALRAALEAAPWVPLRWELIPG